MGKDTAILAVSFGTTHLDTLERSIAATERAIAGAFPECPLYRAFLSPMVMKRLRERHGLETDNVAQALARIEGDGYRDVVIQPTLLLRGLEYELLLREAGKTGLSVAVGRPLLETGADCEELVSIIIEETPLGEREALVLMGHGTEHKADGVYAALQAVFARKGYPCFIGTVYGTPSFGDAVERLVRHGVRRAKLLPLMFVAGDHARNDMAGEGDSLLGAVQEAGIVAEPVFRGLGESRRVQALYVERARAAMEDGNPGGVPDEAAAGAGFRGI